MTPLAAQSRMAIITPSYARDFDRCQLLCETMDHFCQGDWQHLLLVADADVARFRRLEGPRRTVIADSDYLPKWLRPIRNPFDGRMWWLSFSPRRLIRPLSGWHVQQIRKMLAPKLTDAPILLMADSDTVFVRPFGAGDLLKDGRLRFFRNPGQIEHGSGIRHRHAGWLEQSANLLHVPPQPLPGNDYISNLITWRRDVALHMVDHIEAGNKRDFITCLGKYYAFSEYMIYGVYVDEVLGSEAGHWHSPVSLSHTHWLSNALDEHGLSSLISGMEPDQLAFGVQSFTATSVDLIRRWMQSHEALAAAI